VKNKQIFKKKIIYRSTHRGSKEMDLLLGNFVKTYINIFDSNELKDLDKLLSLEDDIIFSWYFENSSNKIIPNSKVSKLLKNFKL